MNYTGNFILLVGPSGAGKTYIEKRFLKNHSCWSWWARAIWDNIRWK